MENNNSTENNSVNKKRYIRLIIIYAVCILLILLAINYDSFASTINKILSVLMPILYGAIIAYLCNPLFKLFFEKAFTKIKSVRLRKTVSLLLTYIIVLIIVGTLLFVIIEQALSSVKAFMENIGGYINNTREFLENLINDLDFIKSESEILPNGDAAVDFIITKESILDLVNEFLKNSQSVIFSIGNTIINSGTTAAVTIFNVVLGFIFSVYILAEKDMLCAKAKKFTTAIFSRDRSMRYIALARYSNLKIGHFIKGKLLESVIVGLMSYILFLCFLIPSPLLLALIVAVMNIIPVFGPFLGAIPAAFLVLIIEPSKAIVCIIIIIIIMQINGNYISPKIIGNSTGLTPLGAITALMLMSGYFGIIGMFIGIPICAIVMEMLWTEMNKRLRARHLSTKLDDYYSPVALAVLMEERAYPKKHKNLTAIVVDGVINIFRKNIKKSNKDGKKDKTQVKNKTESESK